MFKISLISYLLAFCIIITLSGCSLFSRPTIEISQPVPIENATTTEDEFDKTGSEEMHICNSKAICHRGIVLFEAGDVISITANDGTSIEIEDSTCDSESCYVEDTQGREWDLVWLTELN